MKRRKLCLILLIPLILPLVDQAFSLELDDYPVVQCRGGLVSIGDSKYGVLEKCGEPTYVEEFENLWIYDYGPNEFVRYITFRGDRVERIQMGGYGKER